MGATGVAAFNAATQWHMDGCACADKYIGSNPHQGREAISNLYSHVNGMLESFGLGAAVVESRKLRGEEQPVAQEPDDYKARLAAAAAQFKQEGAGPSGNVNSIQRVATVEPDPSVRQV